MDLMGENHDDYDVDEENDETESSSEIHFLLR